MYQSILLRDDYVCFFMADYSFFDKESKKYVYI